MLEIKTCWLLKTKIKKKIIKKLKLGQCNKFEINRKNNELFLVYKEILWANRDIFVREEILGKFLV